MTRRRLKEYRAVVRCGESLPPVVYARGDLRVKGTGTLACHTTQFKLGGALILGASNGRQTLDATDSTFACRTVRYAAAGDVSGACSMTIGQGFWRLYRSTP